MTKPFLKVLKYVTVLLSHCLCLPEVLDVQTLFFYLLSRIYLEPVFTWPPCPIWCCYCTNSKGALLCGWLAGFLTLRVFKISRTLLSANTYSKMHVFVWLLSSMHCTSQSVQLQCSASVWTALPMAKWRACGKSKRVLVYTDEQNIHKIR